jgi:hypothetical protein
MFHVEPEIYLPFLFHVKPAFRGIGNSLPIVFHVKLDSDRPRANQE